MQVVAVGADAGPDEERHAALILATGGRRSKVIGAVALRIGSEMLRPMRKGVVESIARNIVAEPDKTRSLGN
jgi:hypothetical protein